MPPRRAFLRTCAATGLGLPHLLARAAEEDGAGVLAPRPGHFAAKAKHLIVVFLTGGFSHVDTFDYKPRLQQDDGKAVPSFGLRADETKDRPLLGSPFEFAQHGDSGLWISELFPELAGHADDLCVVRSLHTDIVEHFQAVLAMHTGSATVPMPSLGAWLSYGLGTFNPNLPPYVALCERLPYAGSQNWDSHFLPPVYQGVRIIPGPEPIPNLRGPARDATLADPEAAMLRDVDRRHAGRRPGDPNLAARSHSFEVARGLMREAPEMFDLRDESDGTLARYGLERGETKSFAFQCLLARRLVERGVRVVELIDTGAGDNWDAHGDMQQHRGKAGRVDRPIAALLADLKQRGLFSETLLVGCTEFGRTPWTDAPGTKGRNHYARTFSGFLAGAGVKGGTTYGETDDHGITIVRDPAHVHDLHATILHLMGLDHERLTYRYGGRDFRLTDVAGNVLGGVLA